LVVPLTSLSIFIIKQTSVIMPAIILTDIKNRALRRAAIKLRRPAAWEECCLKGCGFSRVVGIERLDLDAGDEKRGTSHMTVGEYGVQ
jgi:hypothetical protein